MIYLLATVHIPSFSGPLVIASKQKKIFAEPPCCCFTFNKEIIYKSCIFFNIYHHTAFRGLILSGADVPSI
jgi:hypothetical protein